MIAEIVSVGTELLLGQITDTHAPTMARILAECGIGCQRRSTIGDNWDRLVGGLKESLERADIVITIGGLGPTVDDLTRDAIAAALGDELVQEPEIAIKLKEFFSARGVVMTDNNLKQALRPSSAQLIENPNGTAPGLLCQKGGKTVIALPGPKGEFEPMAKGPVTEFLSHLQGDQVIHSRVLRVIGIGESAAEDKLRDLMDSANPTLAPYAHTGEVHLRVTAVAPTTAEADQIIDPMEAAVRERLGNAVYGTNDTTLEMAVINQLRSLGKTVSVAESITGGGIGERLTSVPGSSAVFLGGIVAYTPKLKQNLLGISETDLSEHGPVSPQTAIAMAEGVRTRTGSDFAIGITGNAGPTADVDSKPVGLVYVAIAGPTSTEVFEGKFRGLREDIRRRASQLALTQIRNHLI